VNCGVLLGLSGREAFMIAKDDQSSIKSWEYGIVTQTIGNLPSRRGVSEEEDSEISCLYGVIRWGVCCSRRFIPR